MKKLTNKFTKIAINCLAAIATLLVAFLGVFSSPLMNVANLLAEGSSFASSTLTLAKLKNKVKLGNNIEVPKGSVDTLDTNAQVKVVVKNPKGAIVFDSTRASEFSNVTDNGTHYVIKAENVGTYKIQYSVSGSTLYKNLKTQEYKVVVTGEKATLNFEENSQFMIPSVANANEQIVLPIPSVKDSNGSVVSEADVLNRLEVVVKETNEGHEYSSATADAEGNIIKKVGSHYAFTPSGEIDCSYIVTYTYTDAETGLKTIYPPFEIKYEKEFKAEDIKFGYKFKSVENGLSSVPTSLELGTETILPIAEYYDENDSDFDLAGYTDIQVVFTPNSASKEKYASLLEEGKDYVLVAKSNKFTPIYPSSEGTYTITYDISSFYTYAANSRKSETEEKKPDAHLVYKITDAKDSTAPTTYVVNDYNAETGLEKDDIVDVSYLIPTKVKTGTTVNFPAIFAVDNVSSFADMKDTFHRVIVPEKESNITLENQIKTGEEKYKFNETASYTFEKAGTYTIRYEATDKANKYNYTGTTFTIVVEDEFEDTTAPRITMLGVPSSARAGETIEFKKPTAIDYKSSETTEIVDNNLEMHYFYYQTSQIADEDALKAEINKFRAGQDSLLSVITEKENDSSKLSFTAPSTNVTVVCVAIDDSFYLNSSKGISIESKNIKVVDAESDNVAPTISTIDATYKAGFDSIELKQGKEITLPEFVATDAENTEYLEGEVSITDRFGNIVSITGASYVVDGSDYKISNATFKATKSGEYTIVYTLKDMGGNYVIKSYAIEVKPTSKPQVEFDKEISEVEVGETVTLPGIITKQEGEVITPTKVEIVFDKNVKSYRFNKGTNEFTALEPGEFSYTVVVYSGELKSNEYKQTFVAKDTIKPVITTDYDLNSKKTFDLVKLADGTYKAIDLPDFTAEDVLNGIKESKLTVKSPKNNDLTVTKDEERGVYTFVPTMDGAYTVTYSATDNANNTTELVYIIKVGDTTAPSFSFAEIEDFGKRADVKVNSGSLKIDLSKIKISDAGTTKTASELQDEYTNSGVRMFTITVTGPDGSTITSTSDTDIKEYTLANAGTYTITYTARDKAGNEKVVKEKIVAYADDNKSVISTETLNIVLIVVGLAILAGIVIYFVKTRDKKTKKGTPVKLTNDKKDDKKEDKKED